MDQGQTARTRRPGADRRRILPPATDAIKLVGLWPHRLTLTLWVDPATYLPARGRWIILAAPNHPAETENFRWLLPTPANLAKLTVPVPSGFTQVAPPRKGG